MNIGTAITPPPAGFLGELGERLRAFAAALRLRRAHADQLQAEICLDITADATRQQACAARHAYAAEQSDLEAARILRESIADGHITADEIPALRRALRHVQASARHDHAIGQIL